MQVPTFISRIVRVLQVLRIIQIQAKTRQAICAQFRNPDKRVGRTNEFRIVNMGRDWTSSFQISIYKQVFHQLKDPQLI